jgi:hypothetical protein
MLDAAPADSDARAGTGAGGVMGEGGRGGQGGMTSANGGTGGGATDAGRSDVLAAKDAVAGDQRGPVDAARADTAVVDVATDHAVTDVSHDGAGPEALREAGAETPRVPSDTAVDLAGASNICNEIVPDDHVIDGIPAYDIHRCAAGSTSAVWSDDGVNTSASKMAGWFQTVGGAGYQCTEFAHRYLYFKWGIACSPWGRAFDLCSKDLPAGVEAKPNTTPPVHGDLFIFGADTCGAGSDGHVAVVDTVNTTDSTCEFVDQNGLGRGGRELSCALCFLHVPANKNVNP